MKTSTKNKAIARAMKSPRKIRKVLPPYSSYGMENPTLLTKRVNKDIDNTKKQIL